MSQNEHENGALPEATLDPQDPQAWEGMQRLGERMVGDMLSFLRGVRERPVFEPIPEEVRESFRRPLPLEPTPAEEVYEEFRNTILPYPHGNIHPRFWGWVVGTGTPLGMLADMLAAGMNSNSGFGDHCVMQVERQVLEWLREAIGFGGDGGVLTSGCTMANLAGLTLARNSRCGFDIRAKGLAAADKPMTVYGSSETHSSSYRALEILGLGRDSLRKIRIDAEHRVDVEEMRRQVQADRAAGMHPIAVLGSAGTVNTGAFDDLEALATLCEDEGLWLHVDGAFGALVGLAPALRHNLAGIERADSVAFDLHKWLHVPYDAAALLVRDRAHQEASFTMDGAYLSHLESRLATGPDNFMQQGLQMSRGFRALKTWMTIKEHGASKLGTMIQQNVDQAAYLARLVDAHPELERHGPADLNIVCFRYVPGHANEDLDALNRRILIDLHETGLAAPSHTVLDGDFVIRVAITNHRSRRADFFMLVDGVLERGRRLAGLTKDPDPTAGAGMPPRRSSAATAHPGSSA